MTYKLRFHELALKEWQKLNSPIQEQFKKKLLERLEEPCILSAKLKKMPNCYKIKLKDVGYRLVYLVEQDIILVTVIAIGRRDKLNAYNLAITRLKNLKPA